MRARSFAGMFAALTLSACSGSSGTQPPTLSEGAFLPLSVQDDHLVDAEGREVILRGIEHHALQDVDYGGREVQPSDYALIASWGFTTLRMAISWSRIEPTRGQYDAAYLDQIRHDMDLAEQAGLSVILEWHQDLWGRCSQAPNSPNRISANGAPDWTCPTSYDPSQGPFVLFDRLWQNKDGLLDAWIAAWERVVDAVGNHPALLGYDVFNEPEGAEPDYERNEIFPAYRKIVKALRAHGARGLILLDAPEIRNETLQMYTEPIGALDPDLVFAPHLYSGWIRLYVLKQRIAPATKAHDFQLAEQQAKALGLPVFNGEWGVNLDLDGAVDDLKTEVGLEDQYLMGSSYWGFDHAWQKGSFSSSPQALFNLDGTPRQTAIDVISRPYPIQTPGTLDRVHYDFQSATLTVELDANAEIHAPLVLYAPSRELGSAPCLDVAGPGSHRSRLEANRQRLLVAFSKTGHYVVTLRRCH